MHPMQSTFFASGISRATMSASMNSKLRDTSNHGPDIKIFVRDVADKQGRKRPLSVKTWSTIKDVKDALQHLLHVPSSAQRLFFGPLLTSGGELPNHRTLHDAGIYRSGETLLLDIKGGNESASISSLKKSAISDICVSSSFLDLTPKSLRRNVQQCRRGFALGLKPDLVLDGSGGTYYLHDARKVRIAVFKPADEEPYAENNPRGYVRQGGTVLGSGDFSFGYDEAESGMRAGISPGEACVREVAAFLLDHGGFSGVPATTLVEARHPAFNTNGARLKVIEGGASVGSHSLSFSSASISPTQGLPKKVGSLQVFVNAECSMDDLSPSKLTADEVHKIAVLDIRLMNADRNSANLLCRRRPEDPDYIDLVPIDHGYCLRSVGDVSWFDWCWLDWPQTKQPLSKKTKDYILSLDVEADVRVLRERLHIRSEALDYFRASTSLLKVGVTAGLTLYDIALLCCRNDASGEIPSRLEMLMSMATELTTAAIENGRWHHAAATRALVEQLLPGNGFSPPSPRGSLGKKSPSVKPPPISFFKSASTQDLSSFMSEDSETRSPRPHPAMTQSSGSDSSSDPGDATVEQEDCEEWATRVIADVSLDNEQPLITSRLGRSDSVGSDDTGKSDDSSNLSSSPVGFWYIRPGSKSALDEDKDVTWSPHISPRTSTIGMSLSSLPRGVSPDTLIPPISGTLERSQASSVRFDVSPVFLPPAQPTVVTEFELNDMKGDSKVPLETPTMRTSVKRSQSYSAFSNNGFSSHHGQSQPKSALRPSASFGDDDDKVHEYYLKFIDLLVTRETAGAVRQRKLYLMKST